MSYSSLWVKGNLTLGKTKQGGGKVGEKSQHIGFKRIPLTPRFPPKEASAEDEGGRQGLSPALGDRSGNAPVLQLARAGKAPAQLQTGGLEVDTLHFLLLLHVPSAVSPSSLQRSHLSQAVTLTCAKQEYFKQPWHLGAIVHGIMDGGNV